MATTNDAFIQQAERRIQKMREEVISAKATKAQLDRTISEKLEELKQYGVNSPEDVPAALSKTQEEIDSAVAELGVILDKWGE